MGFRKCGDDLKWMQVVVRIATYRDDRACLLRIVFSTRRDRGGASGDQTVRSEPHQPLSFVASRPRIYLPKTTMLDLSPARWIARLRAIPSPILPIAIAIGFYGAINISCWIIVKSLLRPLKADAHQITLKVVDPDSGETEFDRYLSQFQTEIFPTLQAIQAERIKRQYTDILQRQAFHVGLTEMLYVNYLTVLVFAPFASALAAFCIFAIGRNGWAQTDDLTIDTFKVAFGATVLASAFMLIFDYNDNIARQVELFTQYEKLQGSVQSYLATGRLYVKPTGISLTPFFPSARSQQAIDPAATLTDEPLAGDAMAEMEPPSNAQVKTIAWIYEPKTFIEYVDNELARLRSETIFTLDPSSIPSTKDLLNQLESFDSNPVVEPARPNPANPNPAPAPGQ